MPFTLVAIAAIYAAVYITNPFIVISHELGHAIAYLILTKPDRIDIFIGSYGDTKTKLNFKIGKLHFYVKLSLFFINGGMCRSCKQEFNYKKRIIVLLAGSFVSFFVACLIGWFVFNSEVHGVIKLYFFALIICSFISLITNLRPTTIKNTNIDSDGKLLRFTIKIRKVYADYVLASERFLKGDYVYSSEKFLQMITLFPDEEKIIRPLITSLLQTKNWIEAEKYLTGFMQCQYPGTEEYLNLGYLQSVTGRHDLAIKNYEEALKNEPSNLIGLVNLSYEMVLRGNYDQAEELLTKAMDLNAEFPHTYNILGYLNLMNGDVEKGKQLIDKSLEMEPGNAYAYKHLGIYYLKVSDKEQARVNFDKALALDHTLNLEEY